MVAVEVNGVLVLSCTGVAVSTKVAGAPGVKLNIAVRVRSGVGNRNGVGAVAPGKIQANTLNPIAVNTYTIILLFDFISPPNHDSTEKVITT